ncbi:hypothetical protein MCOR27_000937 [Pyricularia oryzae]|uniref:Uncharacterized protein n=5 Tax=Pyricularia TaxID=48558 RepID=A0ABQ8N5D7_PYRGI|nr:uncharacterized protein MGG_17532 [Pyricularia oryzae 70-15]KAH8841371.1 hypothetical protein MCOR01_008037 [Pyricularia oryzae]KAI6291576.1 hypothetical protein MCOR33_010516 [Pyricularia grisea]EHA49439.1 hypothetical protein MGG_17532 [Pyricularia oryzae 70-15]KAH9433289.1 hypothetical protein MCOR02_005343 [Pyricularia oryzae]KAI6261550.1 hypothetical protein MCOR19_002245 [Pyricularia oryzae]
MLSFLSRSILIVAFANVLVLCSANPHSHQRYSIMSSFNIKAAPGTDIWRKPPTTDVYNAPTHAPAGTKTTAPLSKFKSAQVSFTFKPTEQYDQGGVVLSFTPPEGQGNSTSPKKWVKSGVEMLNGTPLLGTVATDRWADWSISPVALKPDGKTVDATIFLQKEGDENGVSLWVYGVGADGVKKTLREICWVFADDMKDWELKVEAYAARPKGSTEELDVEFGGLEVTWSE